MRKWSAVRTVVVAALVLAQGAILAAGPFCVCDSGSSPSRPDHATTHSMPGMPASGHHAPCSHSMPPGGCLSAGACAAVAVVAPTQVPASEISTNRLAVVRTAQAPRDNAHAPEPPPPRA